MTKCLRPSPNARLNPCVDPIFKALFTSNSDDSRKALEGFLSAIFNQPVTDIVLDPNELPIESESDKQSIFDLTCHLANEKRVLNIEMQGNYNTESFDNRSEYHVSHLLNHNVNKGMAWKDIPSAYMISVLNFIYDDEEYENLPLSYSMKIKTGKSIRSQKLNIIYIELPKYKDVPDYPIENLTSVERWAKFFLYANDKSKKEYLKMITLVESGINHAFVALEAISEEERQWCRERDYWDKIATEKSIRAESIEKGLQEGMEKGLQEGIEQGIQEGMEKGLKQGLEQGHEQGRIETYKNLIDRKLKKGKTFEEIAEDLEISIEEINEFMKKTIQ